MHLLIACPVHNREWVLPTYLRYLYNLDYNKKDITIYWIVNNTTDNSMQILQNFKNDFVDEYRDIIIEEYNNSKYVDDHRNKLQRRSNTYYWLAELRNKLLDKCVELNCDYLLSSDSDILMRYDTATQLMSHKEDAVAALIYNGYLHAPKTPWKFCNILKYNASISKYYHVVNSWTKAPWKTPKGKTIPVDFTGACIMISNKAAQNARYGYYFQGEDEPFCKSVKRFGNVLCDLSVFNLHVMDKSFEIKPNVQEYLSKGWEVTS